MLEWLASRVSNAHRRQWLHIVVIVLRLLIGFAFLPAGLKKVLGEPFADPGKVGVFYDFLAVFHDTGFFYQFVGAVQLTLAVMLMTQRFAAVAAMLLLPVLTAILVFCWSTGVIPTASVVTLMTLGTVLLVVWELPRWRGLVDPPGTSRTQQIPASHPTIDTRIWAATGWLILAIYAVATVLNGAVYRPRGAEWDNPSFVMLNVIAVVPIVAFFIDRRRGRARAAARRDAVGDPG